MDADPDGDPTFNFDADPDPDPTLSFTHVGKSYFFYFYSEQYRSQSFIIFFAIVIGVITFNILD